MIKKLDLSKAKEHSHPDIEIGKLYLVKINGSWFFGKFDKEWYGLFFDGWCDCGRQFDAPGFNKSKWEAVCEVDMDKLNNLVDNG